MEELIIQKLDGSTLRTKNESWKQYNKETLENLKAMMLIELDKINNLLKEFDTA